MYMTVVQFEFHFGEIRYIHRNNDIKIIIVFITRRIVARADGFALTIRLTPVKLISYLRYSAAASVTEPGREFFCTILTEVAVL